MPIALRVYATTADYDELAEEPWDGEARVLARRLRSASIEVEKLTRRSWYATDEDGYSTDARVAAAFTEATCAIVEHWADTDDPRGVDAAAGAVKIGSVSLGTTSVNNDSLSAREKLERRIGSKAIDILANAGLLTAAVNHT